MADADQIMDVCWPLHEAVIDTLGISTVLCLGAAAGRWVRQAVGANEKIGEFVEQNARRWRSEAHIARSGIAVLTLTHPGIADWRNPAADPTAFVTAVLRR